MQRIEFRHLLIQDQKNLWNFNISSRRQLYFSSIICLLRGVQVFLQHLGPLSSLPTFTALWLTILDFLAQFVSTASSDLLADALPESLKNMLLVMDTSGRNLFVSGSYPAEFV